MRGFSNTVRESGNRDKIVPHYCSFRPLCDSQLFTYLLLSMHKLIYSSFSRKSSASSFPDKLRVPLTHPVCVPKRCSKSRSNTPNREQMGEKCLSKQRNCDFASLSNGRNMEYTVSGAFNACTYEWEAAKTDEFDQRGRYDSNHSGLSTRIGCKMGRAIFGFESQVRGELCSRSLGARIRILYHA